MNGKNSAILILNYITWEKTVECVESIMDSFSIEIPIVIVDNHSPNDSYAKMKEVFEKRAYQNIVLLQTESNGGFAKGNNFGLRYLKEKEISYAIITNNDVIFTKESINQLFAPLEADDGILLVNPKIMDADGGVTTKPYDYKQTLKEWITGRPDDKCAVLDENTVSKIYSFSGCCLAVNMQNFAGIGFFDEHTFLYCEEAIVSEKANRQGLDIVYNPKAVIVHNHGTTTGKNSLYTDKEFLKSLLYYLRVYENMKFSLVGIWAIMITKFTLKAILKKYHSMEGYFSCVTETFSRCWQLTWKGTD